MRAPDVAALELVLLPPDGSALRAPIAARPSAAADHTLTVSYPDDFPEASPLRPATAYGFRVQAGGELIGEGQFETAPASVEDTPGRLCFGFASCHQPFDREGQPAADALAMLQAAHRALVAHEAKFLLLIGDQVYADTPACYSLHGPEHRRSPARSALLGLPREEVRRRYHRQYRRSWGLPGLSTLISRRSTHCIPDDHEIVDNWGSHSRHSSPAWQTVAAGALDAYWDYQGARGGLSAGGRPDRLWRWFAWGSVAVFVTDIRGERHVTGGRGRVMSEAQVQALAAFLSENAHRHALFIVLGVPMVHIPGWLSALASRVLSGGSDIHDRWSSPLFRPQRDQLLGMLADHQLAHPRQQVSLLSGDIHAGWASTLRQPGGPAITQFVSSALTNHSSSLSGAFARALLEVTSPLEREVAGLHVAPLPGVRGGKNPYGGLNLGLIEVIRQPDRTSRVCFKLIGQDPRDPTRPCVVFESAPPTG